MKTTIIASTILSLGLMLAGGSAFAADEMKNDMAKDGMKKMACPRMQWVKTT